MIPSPRLEAAVDRLGRAAPTRLWPVTTLLAGLALVAVLTSGAGHYVVDNRLDHAWAPGRLLAHQAFLWDASRGLGRVNEQFWPVSMAALGLLRSLGASPALAERLWHAALLTAAGTGAVAVLRVFRPRIGVEHVVAGLFVAFNPYTAASLVPSNVFLLYALAPWLLLTFLLGVGGHRPWRWAATFALLVVCAGTLDVPALVYAAVPIVPVALYLVHVERTTTWPRVLAWGARAGLLSGVVLAAAAVKLLAGAPALAQRLATTESPAFVNLASSWAESWRGLGYWVLYYQGPDGLARPETVRFLAQPTIVLLTFAVPCAALYAAWRSRWRPRLLFLGVALVALVLMVGSYPPGHPPPYGRLLLAAYDRWLVLWGWRNSYKAGAGWALGVGVLGGMTARRLLALASERGRLRYLAPPAVALVLAAGSATFWTGGLYSPKDQLDGVPSYWHQAVRWLDGEPGPGRALMMPGTTVTQYRWGRVGLDLFDPLLRRPYATHSSFPWDTPQTSDLIRALDGGAASGYVAGGLAPVARRLGIRYVVLRNDLDWVAMDRPRPVQFEALRHDPQLRLAATFGRPGQNVVAPGDRSDASTVERTLPPVEIYQVEEPGSTPLEPRRPPLLVAGDGDAWMPLARGGVLGAGGPVRYTGAMDGRQLSASLAGGSPLVVSDTNRRRLTLASATAEQSSYTLAAGQDLDRPSGDLFGRPGSQSVASFGDASRITSSATGSPFGGAQPWLRPANAFDGDPRTAWRTGGYGSERGAWIRAELRRPMRVSAARIVSFPQPPASRHVTRATVRFSDGSELDVDLRSGRAEGEFTPRTTRWVEVRIDDVGGKGFDPVGFSEVSFRGLHLGEDIDLPDDVFRAAGRAPVLARRLATAPLRYQLTRSRTEGDRDEELVLHRRFRTLGARAFDLSGALRATGDTPDDVLDRLLGAPVGAAGSSRYGGAFTNRGGLAVDGRTDTAWSGTGTAGQRLTVHFPAQAVERVDLALLADPDHSRIAELRVTVGGQSQFLDAPPRPPSCPPAGPCLVTMTLPFRPDGGGRRGPVPVPGPVGELTVDITRVDASPGYYGPAPVGIAEVTVPGLPVPPPAGSAIRPDGCNAQVVSVDGADVPVRLQADAAQLLGQQPVPFRACAPVPLAGGRHRLDSAATLLVDEAVLDAAGPPLGRPAPGGAVALTGQSFDPGWRARADGRDLGRPVAMDTQSGWVVPPGTRRLDVRFAPQRSYEGGLAVTLAGLALCLWLALRRPGSP